MRPPTEQVAKAEAFLRLHQEPPLLLLPNAWDVASARLFEEAGFPAVATTSAGIAYALGHPDGQRVGRDDMLAVVARIAAAVAVPVTADLEAGYATTPDGVADTVRAAVAAGAVGMNLEDSDHGEPGRLADRAAQAERVAAAREAADSLGLAFVLNARTDVFLLGAGEPAGRLAHAIERSNAYRAAGADCSFCPGVADPATITALVREVDGPLNVLAGPATPPVAELEALGVRRVSLGSGPMRATLGLVRRMAEELRRGTYPFEGALPYDEAQRLLA